MLENFYDAQYFEDLNQAPYNGQDYVDDSVNVWDEEQFGEATKNLDKTEVFKSWEKLVLKPYEFVALTI